MGQMMGDRIDLKGATGALVMFATIAVAGALIAFCAVEDYARARASAEWPTVEGVILSGNEGATGVRYAWFDGEQSHVGRRISFWTGAFSRTGAEYVAGTRVALHVAPQDGRLAVLESGGSPAVFGAVLFLGGFLLFLGLAGVIRLVMLIDGLAPTMMSARYDMRPAE